MRILPIKRCFRFRRVLTFFVIFVLVIVSIKVGNLFKFKNNLEYTYVDNNKKSSFVLFNSMGTSFSVGSFLKNKSPGNSSYCIFRFGDSDNFNYTEEDASYSPELGDKGPYRVLYSVVEGVQFNVTDDDRIWTVTYVTHITLEYLFHIVEIATRWDGLVSVACFLPGTDAGLALKLLEKMCFCLKEMENVSVHFIYHVEHPPKRYEDSSKNATKMPSATVYYENEESSIVVRKTSNQTGSSNSSSVGLQHFINKYMEENEEENSKAEKRSTNADEQHVESCYISPNTLTSSYRCKLSLVYPVNVARNVARYGSKSKFILVSDIELLPSDNLVPEFLKMIKRLKDRNKSLGDHYFTKKRHVYVVPVFEVSEEEPDVPRTKIQLLDLYAKEKAVYFHRYVCLHCQRFPGLQRWLQRKVHPRTKPGSVQPLLVVKREFPYHRWEPVYIGTNQEPLYSELLTWEGQQDKMTQMHEMCLLDYRFVILNGAFLVHTPGMKRKREKLVYNAILNEANQKLKNSNKTTKPPNLEITFRNSNIVTPRIPDGSLLKWRTEHIKRNAYLYQVITQDVMGKYKNNPRCRIH